MRTQHTILILFLIFSIISCSQTNNNNQISKTEVKDMLQEFQDGYSNRDTAMIDEFLEMFTDDIVYMGIASHEFFKGKESVRKLTLWDWDRWFDLNIKVEEVDIRTNGNVAWIEVVGASGPWRDGKTYEIRMVGSLVKDDHSCLFKQICFSYPAPLTEVK